MQMNQFFSLNVYISSLITLGDFDQILIIIDMIFFNFKLFSKTINIVKLRIKC